MSQPYMPMPMPMCIEIHRDEGEALLNASANSWVTQVKRTLEAPSKIWRLSKRVCIYRVPKALRIFKPEAYAPKVVSLGPYHHHSNDPALAFMNHHKLEAARMLLSRLQLNVDILLAEIENVENEIRECYEEPIDLDKEELSLMLALDACFILEFLRGESSPYYFRLVFPSLSNSMFGAISIDILKLENQIPLSILIKILKFECKTQEEATIKLAKMLSNTKFFRGFPFPMSSDEEYESKLKKYIEKDRAPRHLLDLYRIVIKDILTNSSSESDAPEEFDIDDIRTEHCLDILPCLSVKLPVHDSRSPPRAELLHKAGIKFQTGQLNFGKGNFGISTLFLPQITITEITDILLRNLMAYEECHNWSWSSKLTVISHFVKMMDDLIDSEKDVAVLRKFNVIQSWVGSDEEIASMFNRLCDGTTIIPIQFFERVMKEARDDYKSQWKWKVWMNEFKQEHCSKTWIVLSILAAIVMLSMKAVQTVYSVKN